MNMTMLKGDQEPSARGSVCHICLESVEPFRHDASTEQSSLAQSFAHARQARPRPLTCVKCGLFVHAQCYGIKLSNQNEDQLSADAQSFSCDPCSLNEDTRNLECVLCPNRGGALKAVAPSSFSKPGLGRNIDQNSSGSASRKVWKKWAHIVCAQSIPEVYFEAPETFNEIRGVENISKARRGLRCIYCSTIRGKNVPKKRAKGRRAGSKRSRRATESQGACMQCYVRSCVRAFHATCAQQRGYYLTFKETAAGVEPVAFCWKHASGYKHDLTIPGPMYNLSGVATQMPMESNTSRKDGLDTELHSSQMSLVASSAKRYSTVSCSLQGFLDGETGITSEDIDIDLNSEGGTSASLQRPTSTQNIHPVKSQSDIKWQKISPPCVKSSLTRRENMTTISIPSRARAPQISGGEFCSVCLWPPEKLVEGVKAESLWKCSACDIRVHRTCYGIRPDNSGKDDEKVSSINADTWRCDACVFSGETICDFEAGPACILCPIVGGAMKPCAHVDVEHSFVLQRRTQKEKEMFCHVICAESMPEVYFEHPESKKAVAGLESVDARRFKLKCIYCQSRSKGACIQCNVASCRAAFHPSCALFSGTSPLVQQAIGEAIGTIAFCPRHILFYRKRNFDSLVREGKVSLFGFLPTRQQEADALAEGRMAKEEHSRSKKLKKTRNNKERASSREFACTRIAADVQRDDGRLSERASTKKRKRNADGYCQSSSESLPWNIDDCGISDERRTFNAAKGLSTHVLRWDWPPRSGPVTAASLWRSLDHFFTPRSKEEIDEVFNLIVDQLGQDSSVALCGKEHVIEIDQDVEKHSGRLNNNAEAVLTNKGEGLSTSSDPLRAAARSLHPMTHLTQNAGEVNDQNHAQNRECEDPKRNVDDGHFSEQSTESAQKSVQLTNAKGDGSSHMSDRAESFHLKYGSKTVPSHLLKYPSEAEREALCAPANGSSQSAPIDQDKSPDSTASTPRRVFFDDCLSSELPVQPSDDTPVDEEIELLQRTLTTLSCSMLQRVKHLHWLAIADARKWAEAHKPEASDKSSGPQLSPTSQTLQRYLKLHMRKLQEEEEQRRKRLIEAEADCAVCGSGESQFQNQIVFCDRCDVPVHQHCYGIAKIPEGDWFCQRCRMVNESKTLTSPQSGVQSAALRMSSPGKDPVNACNGFKLQCLLCPIKGGAYKKVLFSTPVVSSSRGDTLSEREVAAEDPVIQKSCNDDEVIGMRSDDICRMDKEPTEVSESRGPLGAAAGRSQQESYWVHVNCAKCVLGLHVDPREEGGIKGPPELFGMLPYDSSTGSRGKRPLRRMNDIAEEPCTGIGHAENLESVPASISSEPDHKLLQGKVTADSKWEPQQCSLCLQRQGFTIACCGTGFSRHSQGEESPEYSVDLIFEAVKVDPLKGGAVNPADNENVRQCFGHHRFHVSCAVKHKLSKTSQGFQCVSCAGTYSARTSQMKAFGRQQSSKLASKERWRPRQHNSKIKGRSTVAHSKAKVSKREQYIGRRKQTPMGKKNRSPKERKRNLTPRGVKATIPPASSSSRPSKKKRSISVTGASRKNPTSLSRAVVRHLLKSLGEHPPTKLRGVCALCHLSLPEPGAATRRVFRAIVPGDQNIEIDIHGQCGVHFPALLAACHLAAEDAENPSPAEEPKNSLGPYQVASGKLCDLGDETGKRLTKEQDLVKLLVATIDTDVLRNLGHLCSKCGNSAGLTVRCSHPSCSKRYHGICASDKPIGGSRMTMCESHLEPDSVSPFISGEKHTNLSDMMTYWPPLQNMKGINVMCPVDQMSVLPMSSSFLPGHVLQSSGGSIHLSGGGRLDPMSRPFLVYPDPSHVHAMSNNSSEASRGRDGRRGGSSRNDLRRRKSRLALPKPSIKLMKKSTPNLPGNDPSRETLDTVSAITGRLGKKGQKPVSGGVLNYIKRENAVVRMDWLPIGHSYAGAADLRQAHNPSLSCPSAESSRMAASLSVPHGRPVLKPFAVQMRASSDAESTRHMYSGHVPFIVAAPENGAWSWESAPRSIAVHNSSYLPPQLYQMTGQSTDEIYSHRKNTSISALEQNAEGGVTEAKDKRARQTLFV